MKQKYGNIQLAKAFFLAAWMLLMTFLPFFSVATPVKADGKITIRLHYSREDGIYEDWSVWLWEEGFQGSDYSFTDEGGDMVTTMDVTPGTTTVYFIIRQPNWVKDIEADQAIDIS